MKYNLLAAIIDFPILPLFFLINKHDIASSYYKAKDRANLLRPVWLATYKSIRS